MAAACWLIGSLRLKRLLSREPESIEEKKEEERDRRENENEETPKRGGQIMKILIFDSHCARLGRRESWGVDGSFITKDASVAWRREAWQG